MERTLRRLAIASVLSAGLVACASNSSGLRDGGHGEGGTDGMAGDTGIGTGDAGDAGMMPDAMHLTSMTCEVCVTDADCAAGYCANLVSGGRACLPGCDRDLPMCPRMFTCIYDASGTGVATTICAPVGGPCCVDEDGDGYGVGVGCMGPDCNDMDANVHPMRDEICDGLDTNCDGHVDEAPNDCVSGRCTLQPDMTYQSITSGVCAAATCTSGMVTPCALYTCHDGGAMGTTCATSCTHAAADDDTFCIASAHCDTGTCMSDLPNGGMCNEDSDCQSSHCDNGYCCGTGTCCATTMDCPGGGGISRVCEDPATCQGARGMVSCSSSNQCLTMSGIPDDSACDSMTLAHDCGLYLPIYCDGTADQPSTPRTCRSSCLSDADCITAAHCTVGVCIPDLPAGGPCSRSADCVSGLNCTDNVCCTSACNGPCEACNLPGMEGTCNAIPRGADPAGECAGYSCSGYYGGFDVGPICFRRADVSDAQASCDGARACVSPDVACPAQPVGVPQVMCSTMCQSPAAGTCTGTVAGICSNLDNPAMRTSCGMGACANSVQMCLGGVPQTCTPGTPSAEVCDGADNNCNGTPDDGPVTALCPAPTNAMTTSCGGASGCSITACNAGYLDMDATYANGCECSVGTSYTNCASALSLGSISPGGSTSANGNIPSGGDRWYTVTFTPGGGMGGGTPHITISDPANFTMQVLSGCSAAGYTCGAEGGTSTSTTDFDFTDNASAGYTTRNVTWPDPVFIHVTRNSPATTCAATAFTVTITR